MTEQVSAGWYPDEEKNARYGDGQGWTEQVDPDGASALEPAAPARKVGAFAKLKKVAADKASELREAKQEQERRQADAALAAGALLTSGVFGSSTVEVYAGGYVRVASWGEGVKSALPKPVEKKTPFESLISIQLTQPVEDKPSGMGSAIEGAVGPAMAGLISGGAKAFMKGSVPGMVASGIAHVATTESRTSFLTITTDRQIHTLTNQTSNGFISSVNKAHVQVGRALEAAGLQALGKPVGAEAIAAEPTGSSVGQPVAAGSAPTVSDRLRELAGLHADGILSDEEFAAAKAKVLSNL